MTKLHVDGGRPYVRLSTERSAGLGHSADLGIVGEPSSGPFRCTQSHVRTDLERAILDIMRTSDSRYEFALPLALGENEGVVLVGYNTVLLPDLARR